jgi:archaellum component FlaC
MTDMQLYLAVGLPVFAIMLNIIVGMMQNNTTNANINARFNSVENRLSSLDSRFDTLTGKVVDIDNRLTRVEAILERH